MVKIKADDWTIHQYGNKYKITYFKVNIGTSKPRRRSEMQQLSDFYEHNVGALNGFPVGKLSVSAAFDLWNKAFEAHQTLQYQKIKKEKSFAFSDFYSVENVDNVENIGRFDSTISRAKARINEYVLCNEFTHFATLTLDGSKRDRFDLQGFIKDFGQMVRDYNKKLPTRLQYLLVPEQHKDGAFHFHGLLKGIQPLLITNEHNHLDWAKYRDKFGFCSLDPIIDRDRCASYMTKYITKDLALSTFEKGAHLFYASHGLNTRKRISFFNDRRCPVKFDYENDYVKIKWLTSDEFAELTI